MSQFLLGVTAFKTADYAKAEDHFKAASENPIGELTSAIALGWTSSRGRRCRRCAQRRRSSEATRLGTILLALSPGTDRRYRRPQGRGESRIRKDVPPGQPDAADVACLCPTAAHYGDFKLARQIVKEQLTKTPGDHIRLQWTCSIESASKEKTALLIDVAVGRVG